MLVFGYANTNDSKNPILHCVDGRYNQIIGCDRFILMSFQNGLNDGRF